MSPVAWTTFEPSCQFLVLLQLFVVKLRANKHTSKWHNVHYNLDLLASKWGQGPRGSCMPLASANSQLPLPFHSGLRVRHGTDSFYAPPCSSRGIRIHVYMYSASKNKIHWLRNPNIVPYCKQSHYIMLLRDLCACPKSVQLHYSDRYF